MLDTWIIEEVRRREREREQPQLPLELPRPEPDPDTPPKEEDRGVVIVPLGG